MNNTIREDIGLMLSRLFGYGEIDENEAFDTAFEKAVDAIAIDTDLFTDKYFEIEDEIRLEIGVQIREWLNG